MKTRLIIAYVVLFPIFSFAQTDSTKAKTRIGFVSVNGGYGLPLLHSSDFTTDYCPQLTINAQVPIEGGLFDFFAVRLSYSHVPIMPQITGMSGGWPSGYNNGNTVYFDSYTIMLGPYMSINKKAYSFDAKMLFGEVISNRQNVNPYHGIGAGLSCDLRVNITKKIFVIVTLDALTFMLDDSLGIGYKLF